MAGAAFIRATQGVIRTTTGTQDFTLSGIGTPKACIVILGNSLADGAPTDGLGVSIGLYDGSNNSLVAIASEDNVADSNTARAFDTSAIALAPNYNGTGIVVEGRGTGFITDGVRINWVTVDGTARYCTVIFICGADASCKVGQFNMSDHTGTPNQTLDVTGCGFNPNLAFFVGAFAISGDVGVTGSAGYAFGIGCLNGSSVVKTILTSFSHRDTRTTGNPSFYSDAGTQGQIYTGFAGAASGSLGKVGTVNLDAFITDGFRVKDVPGGNPPLIGYLAVRLDGITMDAVVVDSVGPGGPDPGTFTATLTGCGAAIIMSTSADALGDKTDSQATGVCYGVATKLEQMSHGYYEEDAVATINNGSISSGDTAILTTKEDGTIGLEYNATFDGTGAVFTEGATNYTTARKQLIWVGTGPVFSGSATLNAGHPDIDATGKLVFQASGNIQGGHPDVDATGKLVFRSSAGNIQGGHPDIDATGKLAFTASGNLSAGHPDIDATARLVFTASGNLSAGHPDIDATGRIGFQASGNIQGGHPDADAAALLVFRGSADLNAGHPDADALGNLAFQASGNLSAGHPDIDSAALLVFRASGDLSAGHPDIDATAITGTVSGTAALIGPSGAIAGLALLVFRASGDLVGPSGYLSGSNSTPIGCVHDMEASHDLVGDLLGSSDAAADLLGSYDAEVNLRGSNC